jgi:hypothetical protein
MNFKGRVSGSLTPLLKKGGRRSTSRLLISFNVESFQIIKRLKLHWS